MARFVALTQFKCPNCEESKIFSKRGFFSLGNMKERCTTCNHKFEKEPGFFFGAMYVSYGLNVAELIALFVLIQPYFDDFFDPWMIAILIPAVFVLFPFNFKLSRVIWMYLFTKKGSFSRKTQ